mgnify:FL=1
MLFRSQIASAIDIMVHLARLRDKSRRVLEISEVAGYSNGRIILNPLFVFEEAVPCSSGGLDICIGDTDADNTGTGYAIRPYVCRTAGVQAAESQPVTGCLKWTGNMLTRTFKLKMAGIRCRLGGGMQ